MKIGKMLPILAAAALLAAVSVAARAQPQNDAASIAIGDKDVGGVVSGPHGPEAGVWVIAETKDLGTRFAKMVVTDERGRYVIPDLPQANYRVWVRGYGLVDSPKVASKPGNILNLTAAVADSRTFTPDGLTSLAFGGGNLNISAGGDLDTGLFFVGKGAGSVDVGGALPPLAPP